ncbi:MAG: hypothetical protein ACI4EA_06890, partial [Candidatus Ornithomonoglobus sp.]
MKKTLKKALERQQALINAARAENREMTADEQRAFDELQIIIDELRAENGEGGTNPTPASQDGSGGTNPTPTPQNGGGSGTKPTPAPPEERGTAPEFTPETAAEILRMCRHFGLDNEAQEYISRGLSVSAAREEIVSKLMSTNRPLGGRITDPGNDSEKAFRAAVTDGILLRQGIAVENPTEGANRFRGMSIKEIGVECLERQGGSADYRHMDADNILLQLTRRFNDPDNTRDFYNPVAAFPAILDDVFKKSYVAGMRRAPVQFEKWIHYGTLPNFKKT